MLSAVFALLFDCCATDILHDPPEEYDERDDECKLNRRVEDFDVEFDQQVIYCLSICDRCHRLLTRVTDWIGTRRTYELYWSVVAVGTNDVTRELDDAPH